MGDGGGCGGEKRGGDRLAVGVRVRRLRRERVYAPPEAGITKEPEVGAGKVVGAGGGMGLKRTMKSQKCWAKKEREEGEKRSDERTLGPVAKRRG